MTPSSGGTLDLSELDTAAYRDTLTASVQDKAAFLIKTIGPRVATAALGMRDARPLRRWSEGETTPREDAVAARLDWLYRVVRLVTGVHTGATAALFLRSASPYLHDGQTPLRLLATSDDPDDAGRQVLAAARALLDN